jgi:ribonucleotide monophosphatase NagD (HAD superfamily)
MSRIRSELAHLKTFIFDCDGVLWRGNEKLPHVANFMKLLREENKNVFFVTNNSTKTPSQSKINVFKWASSERIRDILLDNRNRTQKWDESI